MELKVNHEIENHGFEYGVVSTNILGHLFLTKKKHSRSFFILIFSNY